MDLRSQTDSVLRLPVIGTLIRAYLEGRRDYAKDMSASIAFFSFFSMFPLLLGVIAGSSLFVEASALQSRLDRLLSDAFPAGADFVTDNVDVLFRLRGAAGVASIAGLLWSASKMSGAVVGGLLYEPGKSGFVIYIDNVGRCETVYGPVSSIIVLLLWLYFSARVLLYGAELIAVNRRNDQYENDTA